MRMTSEQNLADGRDGDDGSLVVLAVLALIVGVVSGLVGALFLLLLEWADRLRDALIVWAHSRAIVGFLVVCIACATGAGVAVSHHPGEVRCWGAGDRFGAGARP
jgi:chloride channel protein, CIC family